MHLGHLLRVARLERGQSLRALARTIGVSPSLLSQVETGKTQPSVATLFAMARALDISLDGVLRQLGSAGGTTAALAGDDRGEATDPVP